MTTLDSLQAPLAKLATYLAARREAVLNNWRNACENDIALAAIASLSREEFNNKVPFMLNAFEQHLQQQPDETDVNLLAAEHGLHRWQKGYTLQELLGEMQLLHGTLQDELRLFWQHYPTADMNLIVTAYERLAQFGNQVSTGSVGQYTDLQRISASSRVEVLEKTLNQLNEISRQRTDLLRHSSHDLRGSFGVIQGAASLLEIAGDSAEDRKPMLDMLQRNLAGSQALVTQLMDLARLEAGQERLDIVTFNAGQLLADLVENYQPLAKERGLILRADGPAELMVESDPVHLQRIIQNLVLNALKHTDKGWVSVSWSRENSYRWIVSIQDSGPGLPNAADAGSLPQVLAPSPDTSAAFGHADPEADAQQAMTVRALKLQSSGSPFANKSEGIGLSIVKGLSELLRASVDIEVQPGAGTLFRIRLPIHWQH